MGHTATCTIFTPSDYQLFRSVKTFLNCYNFTSNEEVVQNHLVCTECKDILKPQKKREESYLNGIKYYKLKVETLLFSMFYAVNVILIEVITCNCSKMLNIAKDERVFISYQRTNRNVIIGTVNKGAKERPARKMQCEKYIASTNSSVRIIEQVSTGADNSISFASTISSIKDQYNASAIQTS